MINMSPCDAFTSMSTSPVKVAPASTSTTLTPGTATTMSSTAPSIVEGTCMVGASFTAFTYTCNALSIATSLCWKCTDTKSAPLRSEFHSASGAYLMWPCFRAALSSLSTPVTVTPCTVCW